MHFVDCGPEPPSLRAVAVAAEGWGDRDAYRAFIQDLERPFRGLCGYCERPCTNPDPKVPERDSDNRVDHFRPRDYFQDLTFAWENLIYACRRCNDEKDNQFPGWRSKDANLTLALWESQAAGKQYIEPAADVGYVNPRDPGERAETFFAFNRAGEISPNPSLDDRKWSQAWRTIRDLDLNAGAERRGGLVQLRKSIFDAVLRAPVREDLQGFPSIVTYARRSVLNQG